jgi:hypothetical protein
MSNVTNQAKSLSLNILNFIKAKNSVNVTATVRFEVATATN